MRVAFSFSGMSLHSHRAGQAQGPFPTPQPPLVSTFRLAASPPVAPRSRCGIGEALSRPVLVLQGAKDVQVFANEDTPLLDAALRSRSHDDSEVVVVPNASHDMKFVQDPATDAGITGSVVGEFGSALRGWLGKKILGVEG